MESLICTKAPDFTAKAVMNNNEINESFNLYKYIEGHTALLFFYPLDFTFVCPSEIIAFDNKIDEFNKRNVKVIGISVDSHFTHMAWKNTPVNKGGIGHIKFPLVADLTKDIARNYGVLINNAVALRGTFLIDNDCIIRHMVVNDLPLGRNVDEAIRMVDALYYHEQHGEVCPANWRQGQQAIKPSSEGIADYLASNAENL